jgi:hypothetical protein
MGVLMQVEFFNTFVLNNFKSHDGQNGDRNNSDLKFITRCSTGGSRQRPAWTDGIDIDEFGVDRGKRWYIEESRIRGGFNNTSTDQGVRAYINEENIFQEKRINTLIYSGIYNSRTGVNNTNVFSIADDITRSLDISYGSIQKTYAEETNLIVFQENKIHRALIDKDTIYTTESGTQTQAGAAVIGQFVAYKGDYGISKNPESFAIYNYRKYFSDKNRNAIMRLSNDGLTEISRYGMQDYFRDRLSEIDNNFENNNITATKFSGGVSGDISVSIIDFSQDISVGMSIEGQPGYITYCEKVGLPPSESWNILYSETFTSNLPNDIVISYKTRGKIIGGWDIHNKNYVVSLQKNPNQVSTDDTTYKTLSFDEDINGWVSFFTYKPNFTFSNLNKFYSVKNYKLYEHYHKNVADDTRGDFYGVRKPSNITFVFNAQPSITKNFNTVFYEGSNGWEVESFKSGFTGQDPNPDTVAGGYVQSNDSIISIKSYDEGSYVDANTGYTLRAGFDRKENRYVANLRNNSAAASGEILFGAQMSGIKGYFATVKIETDETTQLGGPKELWSAGTNYVVSSY